MKTVFVGMVLLLGVSLGFAKATAPKKAAATTKADSSTDKRKPQQYHSDEEAYAENVITSSNCRITVTSIRLSGVSDVQQFYSQTPNKAECERIANVHRTNLYPDQVKTKTVIVKFAE